MFPVRQPWLCKALGAFLYPISANAFINTVDICYLLQQRSLHWKKCARLSWKSVATAFFWLGRFYWELLLELIFFFLLLLPLLSCLLVFCFFLFFLGALLMDLQTVRGLFHSSPTGWKSSPPWRRCVVWLYVRCVPPVCWFIMPPQVVMIAVSGALGQCPTHPWWPPCYFMLAWRYFVAAGTKRWPRLRSWSRLTSPAMFRTLRSWPPCEWRLSKFSDYFLVPDFAVWPDVSLWPPPSIKYFQYVIYGLASFFFLYGILLLAEGFYATSAVKQTFGEFRSTQCGRCLSLTVRAGRSTGGGRLGWRQVIVKMLNACLFKPQWNVLCFSYFSSELWLIPGLKTPHSSHWNLSPEFLWPNALLSSLLQFIIVTYILAFIWLAVFAVTAIPVFFLFNMEQTCHNINILAETTPSINQHGWICMDARQYGALLL